ncbi:MAG: two component transcriptional regulator, winged helix family [Dehalococcoidia bacterium]|nr:two component transcriptional regulator, winged helix family [Dehalococcoidia bacterium]
MRLLDYTHTPQNILMIEDDRTLSDVLAEELRSQGWIVRQAYTCAEARDLLPGASLSLLLLDINLPDGNGLALLKEIRELHHLSEVMVVVMSSSPVARAELKHHQVGAFLAKPFSSQQLVTTINGLFSGERQ